MRILTIIDYICRLYFAIFRDKQIGRTKELYSHTLRKLQQYASESLCFEDINLAWLQNYEKHLQQKGNSVNTISIALRNLRAVFNNAIDNDVVEFQYYPFRKFKIKKEETEHRANSIDQLRKVFWVSGKTLCLEKKG